MTTPATRPYTRCMKNEMPNHSPADVALIFSASDPAASNGTLMASTKRTLTPTFLIDES